MSTILDIVRQSREELDSDQDFIDRRQRLQAAWLQAEGDRAMTALSRHYREARRRYERRFGKQPHRALPEKLDEGDWRNLLMCADPRDPKTLLSNAWNADVCLRECPMLSGIIATDENTGKIMLRSPLPLDFWEMSRFEMRPFTQGDVTAIHQYLQSLGLVTIERADVAGAIQRIARENAWRPG